MDALRDESCSHGKENDACGKETNICDKEIDPSCREKAVLGREIDK